MKVINKNTIAELLTKYISYFSKEEIERIIEIPPSSKNYNYGIPCFQLAQHENKAPHVIAQELGSKIKIPDYIDKIEADGPYLNIRIKPSVILKNIIEFKESYGRRKKEREDEKLG